MCLLVETIRLRDGECENLPYHQARMDRAFASLFTTETSHRLVDLLSGLQAPPRGLHKCRVVYDESSARVEITPYHARQVNTLRAINVDELSYNHKFLDRQALTSLFESRGSCDDILIVRKGWVTDCYMANIVFKRGREWITPDSCLLHGTMRQNLLDRGIIRSEPIRKEDISTFESFKLINAMMGFEGPEIDTKYILL